MRLLAPASLLLLTSAALLPSTVNASGMGGGAPPSVDVPTFDFAAEYRQGVEALEAKRFVEAKRSFARVLGVTPRDANLNYLAGLACAGASDFKNARKYFEKAVKYDGKMVQAHRELGVAYAKLGDRAKAEAELASLKQMADQCGGACPDSAKLQDAMAAVTAALGAGAQARLETQPGLLFTSAAGGDRAYVQAVSLINEKRYEDAIESLQAARAAFGAHPDVLTYLGFANRKLGRFEVAEGYYRQALAIAPDHKGATEYFGELMVERGDMAGASKMLARLETICSFGCAEADELRGWIDKGHSPTS